MHMRALVFGLALAACAPPAPPGSQPAAEPPAAQPAAPEPRFPRAFELGALESAALAGGEWVFRADEGTFAAGFGAPESEYQLAIICEAGSGAVQVMSDHEVAPSQATTLTLVTATHTLELPAQGVSEGLPSVTAILADGAPQKAVLIGALSRLQERFGVSVAGEMRAYPWDESIARALEACR